MSQTLLYRIELPLDIEWYRQRNGSRTHRMRNPFVSCHLCRSVTGEAELLGSFDTRKRHRMYTQINVRDTISRTQDYSLNDMMVITSFRNTLSVDHEMKTSTMREEKTHFRSKDSLLWNTYCSRLSNSERSQTLLGMCCRESRVSCFMPSFCVGSCVMRKRELQQSSREETLWKSLIPWFRMWCHFFRWVLSLITLSCEMKESYGRRY